MLRPSSIIAVALFLACASCSRPPIRVYTVESDPGPEATVVSGSVTLPEEIPAGWERAEATGMRKASYRIPVEGGAPLDLSVTGFPGPAGGLAPNVNRWREELQLELLSPAAVTAEYPATEIAGLQFHITDLFSDERATLGAMLPLDAETWFFKMGGAPAAVAAQKDAFISYLKALRIDGASNAGAARRFAGEESPPEPEKPEIAYEIPDDWEPQPLGIMRAASFKVSTDDGAEADIAVIPLGGGGGSDLNNVNQWRAQLGLDPVEAADLPGLLANHTAGDHTFKLVDLEGRGSRMLVAFLKHEGTAWFVKMLGDDKLVAEQKDPFLTFLDSLRF